jgi:membrane protein YdbS with pleckstrin-like domain
MATARKATVTKDRKLYSRYMTSLSTIQFYNIVLDLTHQVRWAWYVVFAPLTMMMATLAVLLLIAVVLDIVAPVQKRRKAQEDLARVVAHEVVENIKRDLSSRTRRS